jgi:hypothetical protein
MGILKIPALFEPFSVLSNFAAPITKFGARPTRSDALSMGGGDGSGPFPTNLSEPLIKVYTCADQRQNACRVIIPNDSQMGRRQHV